MSDTDERPINVTIGQHWMDYVNAVHNGAEIHPIQYQETRRAFYAGAMAHFASVMAIPDDATEDEIVEHCARLKAEIDLFNKAVQRGEA